MDTLASSRMSEKEMIDTLKGLVFGAFDRTSVKERIALDMAIKKLEQAMDAIKGGDIINLDEYRPQKVSVVVCLKCLKRWVSVRPVETTLTEIECPNCGKGYVIETGESIENVDTN